MTGKNMNATATQSPPIPNAPPTARPAAAPVAAPRRPIYRRPIGMILLVLIVIAGIGGTAWWLYARQFEETDDAFIDGNVIPIGARVAGQVQAVNVNDNQLVKAGDVLAVIDPRDIQARLAQANAALDAARAEAEASKTNVQLTQANTQAMLTQGQAGVESANAAVETAKSQLESAEADVTSAQAESTRRQADEKRLTGLDKRGVSEAQLDATHAAASAARSQVLAANKRVAAAKAGVIEAKAKVAAAQGVLAAANTAKEQVAAAQAKARYAEAQVGIAQAQVDAARLDLSYTTIKAPTAGRVTRKNIQPGQYLQVGQTLLAIVPDDFWVTANFKETQLTEMRVGQPVDIYVDTFPDRTFHGHVQSIQAGTGARFSMLPAENATGNFVKVVQRVPVKITFDKDHSDQSFLGVGMSVVPKVRITETPEAKAQHASAR
jgi:membrane fusion protein (multidrug efflux system)